MKHSLYYLSLFFCSLACWLAGSAQSLRLEDLKFKNYTPAAGLPSDFIQTISQDKFGFLWMGTHNGLIRYDGTNFTLYQHSAKDSNSIPANDVPNLAPDPTGKCWLASRKGLWYFDYTRNDFRHQCSFLGKPLSWASGATVDSGGCLWFVSNLGVCRLDYHSGVQTVIAPPTSTTWGYTTNNFYCTRSGSVWLFDSAGLFQLDTSAMRFRIFPFDPVIYRSLMTGIRTVFESPGKILWIASYAGFFRYDIISHLVTKIGFSFHGILDPDISITGFDLCPALTGDSVLWCSTPYQGLVLFNLRRQKFTGRFLQDPYDATSLGGSLCYNSFVDRSGILWIAQFNGLTKLDWRDQRIKSRRIRQMVDANRLVPIRKMLQDPLAPDRFWLITWNYGALYYDKTTNRVLRQYKRSGDAHPADISALYDGVYDSDGILWIGTERGVCYFDTRTKHFLQCPVALRPPGQLLVVSRILTSRTDEFMLGTESGLWTFSLRTKKYRRYVFTTGSDTVLTRSAVYALRYDQSGRLYVGSRHGLFLIDTLRHSIHSLIRPIASDVTDFNVNYIWGLDVDRRSRLWVATRGGGLYNYDPVSGKYQDYPIGRGLTTEELRDVYVDTLQRVWISSYEGIYMLEPSTGHFVRYGPEDGLDNFNLSLGRWTILDNKIYSGSPGAYSIIDPYAHSATAPSFPVWITGSRTDNKMEYFNPDSTAGHILTLSPSETNISIAFAGPAFSGTGKNRFAYQLSGIDKDWQEAGDQTTASYHRLPPGHYVFQIKSLGMSGEMSPVVQSLQLELLPPFWRTGWFWLLVILSAGAFIWYGVARRIARIRRLAAQHQQQAVVRQQLVEMEMMALRSQMNPHFIFNCMNIMDALITEDRKEAAQQFIQQFSRLLRLVLENSAHPLVPLRSEQEALTLYIELEVIRHNQSFSYQFSVDPELSDAQYRLPPMLLQPYVENAIVHGLRHREMPGGQLRVSISRQGEQVLVCIEDNGIGRAQSLVLNEKNRVAHQPVALRLTGKRVELLRRTNSGGISVSIEDLENGTRVKLRLPLYFTLE